MIDIGRDLQKANDEGYANGYDDGFNNGYDAGYGERDLEIVRCKDCKHFMPYSDIERAVTQYKDTDGICHGGYPRANDFFCADGKRRSE